MRAAAGLFGLMGVIAVCAAKTATAHAADISWGFGDRNRATVVIEGTIQKGDCDSLLNLIRKSFAKHIYLASPGGNLLEAMRIGRLVRLLKLSTIVPAKRVDLREQLVAELGVKDLNANLMCASACFFVFVAGVHRSQDFLFGPPMLGIHRPYLSDNDLKGLSSDRSIAAATQARTITESYLKEMSVRAIYADQMFSIVKDQVHWIPKTQFKSDFEGFLPELQDWINVHAREVLDRVRQTDTSNFSSQDMAFHKRLIEILSDPNRREEFVLDDLQFDAWQNMIGLSGAPGIFDIPRDPPTIAERAQSFCRN